MPRDWRVWAAGLAAFLGALLVARRLSEGGAGGGGATIPGVDPPSPGSPPPPPVDPYAPREIATADDCDPSPKPGVLAFRKWAIEQWGERAGSPQNIVRDCSVGGASEHKQGRAWDQMVDSVAHGQMIADMLTAPDAEGNPNALARRAGIMNMIFDGRIWRSYPQGDLPAGEWGVYTGANKHTDHLHYSFGWPGANAETSLYGLLDPAPALVAGAPYRLAGRPWRA